MKSRIILIVGLATFACGFIQTAAASAAQTKPTKSVHDIVRGNCSFVSDQVADAISARDQGVPIEKLQAKLPARSADNPYPVRVLYDLLDNVYRMPSIGDPTMLYFSYRVCLVEHESPSQSRIKYKKNITPLLLACQAEHPGLQLTDEAMRDLHFCVTKAVSRARVYTRP
jgi:hypothetical protein